MKAALWVARTRTWDCSSAVVGVCVCVVQVSMSLMCNPPKQGDVSFEQYKSEKAATLASLRRRAHIMTDAFNACEGITSNFVEGAMYSFPRLHLPPRCCAKQHACTKTGLVAGCSLGLQRSFFHTVACLAACQLLLNAVGRTRLLPPSRCTPI